MKFTSRKTENNTIEFRFDSDVSINPVLYEKSNRAGSHILSCRRNPVDRAVLTFDVMGVEPLAERLTLRPWSFGEYHALLLGLASAMADILKTGMHSETLITDPVNIYLSVYDRSPRFVCFPIDVSGKKEKKQEASQRFAQLFRTVAVTISAKNAYDLTAFVLEKTADKSFTLARFLQDLRGFVRTDIKSIRSRIARNRLSALVSGVAGVGAAVGGRCLLDGPLSSLSSPVVDILAPAGAGLVLSAALSLLLIRGIKKNKAAAEKSSPADAPLDVPVEAPAAAAVQAPQHSEPEKRVVAEAPVAEAPVAEAAVALPEKQAIPLAAPAVEPVQEPMQEPVPEDHAVEESSFAPPIPLSPFAKSNEQAAGGLDSSGREYVPEGMWVPQSSAPGSAGKPADSEATRGLFLVDNRIEPSHDGSGSGEAYLIAIPGRRRIPLPMGEFTIGRSPSCGLCISQPTISGLHAVIIAGEGCCVLIDKNSKNGTFINGSRIIPGTQRILSNGDLISIHKTEFQFHCS